MTSRRDIAELRCRMGTVLSRHLVADNHSAYRRLIWLYRYRLHDTTGDDLGMLQHPAPNVDPGDVAMLEDGCEALVTARVETYEVGPFAALLEVAIAPTPLTSDEGIA